MQDRFLGDFHFHEWWTTWFDTDIRDVFGIDVFESNQINAATPFDTWTLLGVGTAPAPAGTAWARAVIVKVAVDGFNGGSIFWDDASLRLEIVRIVFVDAA